MHFVIRVDVSQVIAMLREMNKLIVFRAAKIKGLMTRKPSETMYQVNRFEQWSEQILQQEYNPCITIVGHVFSIRVEKSIILHMTTQSKLKTLLATFVIPTKTFFGKISKFSAREILYVLAIVFALNGYPVSSYNSNLFDGNGERIIIYYLINRNANLFV